MSKKQSWLFLGILAMLMVAIKVVEYKVVYSEVAMYKNTMQRVIMKLNALESVAIMHDKELIELREKLSMVTSNEI